MKEIKKENYIYVIDGWRLKVESYYSLVVESSRIVEDSALLKDKTRIGSVVWDEVSYHSNIRLALKSIKEKCGLISDNLDLLYMKLDEVDRNIEKLAVEYEKLNKKQIKNGLIEE